MAKAVGSVAVIETDGERVADMHADAVPRSFEDDGVADAITESVLELRVGCGAETLAFAVSTDPDADREDETVTDPVLVPDGDPLNDTSIVRLRDDLGEGDAETLATAVRTEPDADRESDTVTDPVLVPNGDLLAETHAVGLRDGLGEADEDSVFPSVTTVPVGLAEVDADRNSVISVLEGLTETDAERDADTQPEGLREGRDEALDDSVTELHADEEEGEVCRTHRDSNSSSRGSRRRCGKPAAGIQLSPPHEILNYPTTAFSRNTAMAL